jgi:hypothetical protein
MTLNELATEIAKREGNKSQARIGDIREIIGILSDLSYNTPQTALDVLNMLVASGAKRAKMKAKKAPKAK